MQLVEKYSRQVVKWPRARNINICPQNNKKYTVNIFADNFDTSDTSVQARRLQYFVCWFCNTGSQGLIPDIRSFVFSFIPWLLVSLQSDSFNELSGICPAYPKVCIYFLTAEFLSSQPHFIVTLWSDIRRRIFSNKYIEPVYILYGLL